MKNPINRFGWLRPFILSAMVWILLMGLCMPLKTAEAHSADAYLQATYITIAPEQIVVELDISPGVLLAPDLLAQLDSNGDQQISEAEGQAYVAMILPKLLLQVDGSALTLNITKIDLPAYLNFQAGYATIRIFTEAALASGMSGAHQLTYTNTYQPKGATYQVNAFVDKGIAVTLGKQNRDSIQQSLTMEYTIGSPTQATTTSAHQVTTGSLASLSGSSSAITNGQAEQLLAFLYAPTLSPWVLLAALGLAALLGGLHALTPGHGKTLVAAYLVGSRGTVRHAILLGTIVTFTHTASVILIGLLALFASQYIVPDLLMPMLEISSGVLVVIMGFRLVWQRWKGMRNQAAGEHQSGHTTGNMHLEEHPHPHPHTHDEHHHHDHEHTHDHGNGQHHSHTIPERITFGSLLAMGVSGGLVPCPEALGILVIAIGLKRLLFGLGLIISFSIGLAAVLIIIGILLVRSRTLVERFSGTGSNWSRMIPLASAVMVTLLGFGMTISGFSIYLR